MHFRWILLAALAAALVPAGALRAEEPYVDFLQKLRERSYFDYALLYLDQLEKKPGVPAGITQGIAYERAVTLLAGAETLQSPEAQQRQYDQALSLLQQFVREHPDHDKVGEAQSEVARILRGKARVLIGQSRSPGNEAARKDLQKQARDLIQQARSILQSALDRHQKTYEGFAKFIPEEDTENRKARNELQAASMSAELDLAECTFREAQTYDPGSHSAKLLLTKAADQFEELHTKYRQLRIDLYAQMWQGKCYEEQGEIGKALGIYNQLLSRPDPDLKNLQDQVRLFRLTCLNDDQRKDYQLVVSEASDWLKQAKSRAVTSIGLGIAWQRAVALERLGQNPDTPQGVREGYLKRALDDARLVNQYPGDYRDDSLAMVRRIQITLRGRAGDPTTFPSALGLADQLVNEFGQLEDSLEAARSQNKPSAEIEALRQGRDAHLRETARMFNLALSLVDEKTDDAEANRARYRLAYVYYQLGRSYDAAVLSEYVARLYGKEHPDEALDAAILAMAAYVQSYYSQTGEELKQNDARFILRAGASILTQWPDSERADDVRIQMGLTSQENGDYETAAEWFAKVPESSDSFPSAQLKAGQAYWDAYLRAGAQTDADRPPAEKIARWQNLAQQHLETGLKKYLDRQQQSEKWPDDVIYGKVSLANILVERGNDREAIRLLTEEPHPATAAVQADGSRPAKGLQSKEYASYVYQLLLRAQIGAEQLDAARTTMSALEALSGDDSQAVMALYTDLGRKLRQELDRLKNLGDTKRLGEVRATFENFLGEMFRRQDGENYRTLAWIGETYYGLGQGMEDQKSEARAYFAKAAAAFESILKKAAAKPDFADEQNLLAVKLRLVTCKRNAEDYQGAFELVSKLLAEKSKFLDAQIEAAYVLEDWGACSQPNAWKKYKKAIDGTDQAPGGASIWGWGEIALRLERMLDLGQANDDYAEKRFEARYHQGRCRHRYALAQPAAENRVTELEKARQELRAFAALTPQFGGGWREKFDVLYRNVQQDLNRYRSDGKTDPIEPLPTPIAGPLAVAKKAEPAPSAPRSAAPVAAADAAGNQPGPGGVPGLTLAVAVVIACVVAGGVFYFGITAKSRNRRTRRRSSRPTGKPPIRARR